MRTLFKIILFPIALFLGIFSNFLRFLVFIGGGLVWILSCLMATLITVVLLFGFIPFSQALGGYFICFLFSPYGLFAVANWLLDKVDIVTYKIKEI